MNAGQEPVQEVVLTLPGEEDEAENEPWRS